MNNAKSRRASRSLWVARKIFPLVGKAEERREIDESESGCAVVDYNNFPAASDLLRRRIAPYITVIQRIRLIDIELLPPVLQTAKKRGVPQDGGKEKKKGFYSRVTPRSNFSARQSDYVLRRVPTTPANRASTLSSYGGKAIDHVFFYHRKKNWRSKYVGARRYSGNAK